MVNFAYDCLGFPKNRVMGMAGVLDSARMRYFISLELGVAPHRVEAMVLGGHGDLMVPVTSSMLCDGKPIQGISDEKKKAIIERTQNGGAEIVKLLKTGSAFYSTASSITEMVKAIINNENKLLPACCRCDGEYGIKELYCGVVAKLGRSGVISVEEVSLTAAEKAMLAQSVEKVGSVYAELKKMDLS
jgi:malate dehydrogenase